MTRPYPARGIRPAAALCAALLSSCATGPRAEVLRVRIPSPAMGGKRPALVCLPPAYEFEPERRFPVVYLLHGARGDHTSFVRFSPLVALFGMRDIIAVCPDGGGHGWYVDSPRKPGSNVETHIVREVVPYIDSNFRTDARPEARGITGYSMGGHGALTLAAKHPDVFRSASSLSGILDITRWPRQWLLSEAFGPLDENRDLWVSSSAMGLAPLYAGSAKNVAVLVDCGRADVAFEENRDYHRLLETLGRRHVYRERPGSHGWQYWGTHLAEHLDFHLASFESAGDRARAAGED